MYGAIVQGFRDESLDDGEATDICESELTPVRLGKPPRHYDSLGGYEVSQRPDGDKVEADEDGEDYR